MKKLFLKVSAIAGMMVCSVSFSSCTQDNDAVENVIPNAQGLIPVEIRGSIGGDSRTKLSDSDSKTVEFQSGDSLAVWDGQGDQKIRRFGTDGSGNVAIFKGNLDPNASNLNILYPFQDGATCTGTTITATIPATQTATAGTFDPKANLAAATADYTKGQNITCTLQNVCGLLKFTVDQAYDKAVICGALGEKIAGKVTIDASTGAVTATAESADLIILEDGLTPGNTYCVAMIPQEYKDGISIKLYGSDGKLAGRKRILKSSGAVTVKPSVILNLGEVAPESTEPLTGEFSVGTGKVKFSKGNLQAIWNDSTSTYDWSFEERQWDLIGDATRYGGSNGNTHIDGNGKNNLYAMVDLFGWTKSDKYNDGRKQYGINASQTPADYGNSNTDVCCDWGGLITDGNTWLVLTKDEWTHLLNSRTTAAGTAPKINNVNDARWMRCNIDGITGLLIFPDTFTWPTGDGAPLESTATNVNTGNDNFTVGYSKTQFAALEKSGVVFLPCSGARFGTTAYYVGQSGVYWSSSFQVSNASRAYYLDFNAGYVNPAYSSSSDNRYYGLSVRLVCSAE